MPVILNKIYLIIDELSSRQFPVRSPILKVICVPTYQTIVPNTATFTKALVELNFGSSDVAAKRRAKGKRE